MILHITKREEWEKAKKQGEYKADSLISEGFIHFSKINQVIRVANYIFKGEKDLVLLLVDDTKIKVGIKFEDGGNGEFFPHLYGPLNTAFVTKIINFPESEDGFHLPEEIKNCGIELLEGFETLNRNEVISLYKSVGWTNYTTKPDDLMIALENSTYIVVAKVENTLIGLARSISDNSSIHYLQDILVHQEFQRKGIARKLLNKCLHKYEHVRTHVLLTDDEEKQIKFYKSLGYSNTRELQKIPLNCFVKMKGIDLE